MKKYGKVAVLMGGKSAERSVSLNSGTAVLTALQQVGVDAHAFDPSEKSLQMLKVEEFDCAMISLHGRFGEDGTVQGALELLEIPYTGSGVLASSVGMDKWRTKLMWQATGIPTPAYVVLTPDSDFDAIEKSLGLPIVVKPAREGSSFGLSKVDKAGGLRAAFDLAAQCDTLVIAEQFIAGAEYTAAILGDTALPLVKVEPKSGFYDHQAKYVLNDTVYRCPCLLPAEKEAELQAIALQAFRILGCTGWGRIDIMLDAAGHPYCLEVNTSPGMTERSLVPKAAAVAGLSFTDLVLQILDGAYATTR